MKKFLGDFEELTLLAVLSLGNDAYGVSIAEKIEEETGKRVSIGSLYTTLGRLEQKGYLRSGIGEATEERGGRAKKYYFLDGLGEKVLRENYNIKSKWYERLVPQHS